MKTKAEKLPAGWRVSSRTLRRVFKGRGRILGASWVCKLVDMVSGRRSFHLLNTHQKIVRHIEQNCNFTGNRIGFGKIGTPFFHLRSDPVAPFTAGRG